MFVQSITRIAAMALCIAGVVAISTTANAQNVRSSVDRHTHPEGGFFENQRTSRTINHARDYSNQMYQYSQSVPTVMPQVMKSESQMLGQNIVYAQQQVAGIQAQVKSVPANVESVKVISQHLAKAAELHKELDMECCKATVDGKVCSKCCSNILKELDKAAAEHNALTRQMDQEASPSNHEHKTDGK